MWKASCAVETMVDLTRSASCVLSPGFMLAKGYVSLQFEAVQVRTAQELAGMATYHTQVWRLWRVLMLHNTLKKCLVSRNSSSDVSLAENNVWCPETLICGFHPWRLHWNGEAEQLRRRWDCVPPWHPKATRKRAVWMVVGISSWKVQVRSVLRWFWCTNLNAQKNSPFTFIEQAEAMKKETHSFKITWCVMIVEQLRCQGFLSTRHPSIFQARKRINRLMVFAAVYGDCFTSSSVSLQPAAPMLSSSWWILVVPAITEVTGAVCSNHLMATWPGVLPVSKKKALLFWQLFLGMPIAKHSAQLNDGKENLVSWKIYHTLCTGQTVFNGDLSSDTWFLSQSSSMNECSRARTVRWRVKMFCLFPTMHLGNLLHRIHDGPELLVLLNCIHIRNIVKSLAYFGLGSLFHAGSFWSFVTSLQFACQKPTEKRNELCW